MPEVIRFNVSKPDYYSSCADRWLNICIVNPNRSTDWEFQDYELLGNRNSDWVKCLFFSFNGVRVIVRESPRLDQVNPRTRRQLHSFTRNGNSLLRKLKRRKLGIPKALIVGRRGPHEQ